MATEDEKVVTMPLAMAERYVAIVNAARHHRWSKSGESLSKLIEAVDASDAAPSTSSIVACECICAPDEQNEWCHQHGRLDDLAHELEQRRAEARDRAAEMPGAARLDADGTAKPKTEIVGVFPAGKRNFYGNAQELIARPTGIRCGFCRHWKEHHNINGTACGYDCDCPTFQESTA